MEAVTEHLQALVEACVAVSAAAAISTPAGDAAAARVHSVDASLGLPPEHLEYWDVLCDDSLPLVEDLALLLASTNVSTSKMLSLLRVILVHASFHCAGLVRLVQLTFHGFKLTKRWDVLSAVSSELLDAIYAKILQSDTRVQAFRFYVDVLGGFQHSAELLTANVTKLIQLAKLFSTEDNEQNREMAHLLLVLCAALEHCHRGYEAEAMALRRAMRVYFGSRVVRPTAAEAERLLRASAWVLPAEKLDAMLPSIEGKWVADEFTSDQHCNGGPHQNAGSVLLKKTTNCFAYEVRATITDPNHKFELTGSLFQRMPEMQVLLSHSDTMAASTWDFEGHWRELNEEITPAASAAPVATIPAPTWNCRACTMNNEGSLAICSTCGTRRPVEAAALVVTSSGKGNNPAPFSAVLSADMSFMRMKWSRGEQQGVWLARKQTVETAFDLATSLAAGSDAMTDTTCLPAFVFSPEGVPANILVLERPILSTSDHTEFTVQVWIRPQHAPPEIEAQVVIANGHDFELLLTSAGRLVWHLAGGRFTVTSRDVVQFGVFCHVTLSFGHDTMGLLVNGSMAGETIRPDETHHSVVGVSLLTIGGSIENCDLTKNGNARSCFYGQMLDLRIYSTLLMNDEETWSIRNALSGREEHLVGYFPFVGDSERLLMDLSSQQNHACVVEGYQLYDSVHHATIPSVRNFAPVTPVHAIPVENTLAISLGIDFIGCGKFSFSEGCRGLDIDCGHSGATLWRQNAVSIACGFQSFFSLAPPVSAETPSSRRTVLFALCETTFWNLVPLLSEAIILPHVASDGGNVSPFLFDGSAMLLSVSSDVVAPGILMYELGLYIWSGKQGHPLSRVYRVAGNSSTSPSDVQIKYGLPERALSVAIGGVGIVFEVALDLELALRVEPGSPVRVGLIFPASKDSISQRSSSRLTKWTFGSSLNTSLPKDAANSILGNVYSSLRPKGSDGDRDHINGADSTILCTRMSTDGSAVAQQSYGCQTCNLVHGNSVCRFCAVICHESHELVALGVTTTACACRVRGNGLCRCNSAVQASDFPMLTEPVNASLWGCSKCTVINSRDQKQCSVCGNNAPEQDACSTSAVPEPTFSASAPVEQPTPAVAWSCDACTMLNEANDTKCSVCDTLRTKQADPVAAETYDKNKTGEGLTTLYYAAGDAVKQDHPMAMQPTCSWICSACTMENKTLDTTCHMCGTVREVPVATAVDSPEVMMALPAPKIDDTSASTPAGMDTDMCGGDRAITSGSVVTTQPAKIENMKILDEYKRTTATAFDRLLEVERINDSVWETTGGKMHVVLGNSFVGEYICGTYLARDGTLSGLARATEEGSWKLDGRFKKASQSQSNACVLSWNKTASRFDGKWYRGDGSGDWKCLASPYTSDFRGLACADAVKKPTEYQPYYTGMVNMKQNLSNVCYQNSFLQTLYMTQDFRRFIMSCDAKNYAVPNTENGSTSGGNVVAAVQDLFAQMTASQRPFVATHALQQCLPAEFKNGRQQDTSDFAHFLIDSLSQRLSQHQAAPDEIPSIFGGHQATILACKTCGKKSVNREYFWELLLNMIDLRYTPITSISAVSGSAMDIRTPDGYERLNADLNKDRTGAPYVYLCVQRCPERVISGTSMEDEGDRVMAITELVVRVALSTDPKPSLPGFERVELDLNVGGSTTSGSKKQVYLLFRREPNGSPITDLQIMYGNESIPDGFKQIQVDLNQGEGSKVYLCYRCDMPITDLKIVNSGIPGYRMVDHLLNVGHEDVVKQYLALKVGGHEPCLTDLKLVQGSDVSAYEEQGWQSIGSPFASAASADPALDGRPFVPAQLVVRRGHGNPIFAIDVFRAPRQVPKYKDYEIIELSPAESSCTDLVTRLKGDWVGTEETERERKGVRIRSVSEPILDALLVKGCVDDKGELCCIVLRVSTWADPIARESAPGAEPGVPIDLTSSETRDSYATPCTYRVSGYWKNLNVPSPQLVDVELRPAAIGVSGAPTTPSDMLSSLGAPAQSFLMSGIIGDGKGSLIAIQGVQRSQKVDIKWPICEIMVLRGDECVPEGVEVVRTTCSGRSGNLLAQTASPRTLYLAFKREEEPANGYITDVCVIYGEIDAVPEHYTCIHTTPAGHSANVNDGTLGVPIFICFKQSGSTTAVSDEGVAPKSLMDLALMWTSGVESDDVPAGFTKIQHTPLGMEANLNQGTCGVAIHICQSKSETRDIVKPLDNPLNGEYEITSSLLPAFGRFLTLSVVEKLEDARLVEGSFGAVLHAQFTGSMRGILFSSKHQQTGGTRKRTLVGAWRTESSLANGVGASANDFLPLSYPFEWTLNETWTELDGWWSGAGSIPPTDGNPIVSISASATSSNAAVAGLPRALTGGKWKLIKDSYVHVAFKKDYSTEWQDGQLVFSERVWRHDIASMLSRFVATRTLGGDNALSCSVCERKTEWRTHTVIDEPPEHLIITLKRMYYDWNQQKACKCLHDVQFPALLTLPSLTSEEELAVYTSETDDSARAKQQHPSRHYGLYGVLVHSGLTASSGHYYSFCRESDDSTCQLHLEDSPLSPWIKFNDTKVEHSSWREINRLVASTVSDTVYLLLYKRLSYEPSHRNSEGSQDAGAIESGNADDEEAMLLAKAMALSMSAARHDQQRHTEEEETKGDPDAVCDLNGDDGAPRLTGTLTKVVLKKVEDENAAYLHDMAAASSSALHADDIHTLLVLRHSLPVRLRALLDRVC
ncbi:unnamed protein product [Hyaloperonospora brassicae]|uniref:Ubiquitinyl hydrolase 1 n=1 Tax=Hyaloperonospora brassicae TaxID=162125 RepID=A0AAV0U959_HYABA|nr:unnamed protein product [Hyaloperonospora brassicae]